MFNSDIFRQNLKKQRLAMGITQEELSEKAGLECKFFGTIERGQKPLTVTTILAILNALNIGLQELMESEIDEKELRIRELLVLTKSLQFDDIDKQLLLDFLYLIRKLRDENE